MELFEAIKNRRSIRKYKEDAVENEKILKVLEVACFAPSAANRQPYGFVVVTEKKTIQELSSAAYQEWSAPAMIVVCVNPKEAWIRKDKEEFWKVDAGLIMQNISLIAHAEGLGTCWICAFDEKKAKTVLGVKKPIRIVAMTPLGYPAEIKGPVTNRKNIDELVHYEKW
ncbi:MAG: nitroreductase family protein [Candidatus Bathyarchaeota archaeon]|nr:nitroreductase family protein [Candidatus Bathyarchaeum tardum]